MHEIKKRSVIIRPISIRDMPDLSSAFTWSFIEEEVDSLEGFGPRCRTAEDIMFGEDVEKWKEESLEVS